LPHVADVDTVVFDAYGTLFDIEDENWAPADVVRTMRRKQLEYTWLLSLMGHYQDFPTLTRRAIEYAKALYDEYNVDVENVMRRLVHLQAFPDVEIGLKRLGDGRRLGILSNGHPDDLEQLCIHAGLRARFEWLISAHEVRIYKPAPAVYRLALERTGTPRDRLLFVSANSWDVAGAGASGLRAAWVNRTGDPPQPVGGEPEVVVRDLEDLASTLE